jgi:4,5-DOPA dioxygenase extradiol
MLESMQRREALRWLSALPAAVAGSSCRAAERNPMPTTHDGEQARQPAAAGAASMPVLFISHGAPILMDDQAWVDELAGWARALPRPKAVLMLSAHWDKRPATLGATQPVPLYYDFYGFPEKYYGVKYPAPGAPALAARVKELFAARSLPVSDSARGLDHGAYIPLLCMYPNADVPVLQLSLPGLEPKALFELGSMLAPLRKEGVLVVGSGFLTHNMRYAFRPETPGWAREFDDWAGGALARGAVDELVDFKRRAPAAEMALPTTEHFVPVIVAAGAAEGTKQVSFPITGFWNGSGAFTRRSVEFG